MNLETDISLRYWSSEHLSAVNEANSFAELRRIAMEHLQRMPQPIAQVCGPISTGGFGIEKNLEIFEVTIRKLMSQGKTIFNQIPFETPMKELNERSPLNGMRVNQNVLDDFYLDIFKSELIYKLYFVHGWETSYGARWERRKARELGMRINYLPEGFHLIQ
ncbi:MAG: hypothetical protein ABIH49_00940 [archaeon]